MNWLPPQNASETMPWSPPPQSEAPATWSSAAATPVEATLLRRAGGLLIDLLLFVACFFLPFIIGGFIAGIVGTTQQTDDRVLLPIAGVVAALLMLLLPVALTARRGDANGQTLGKQAVGLRAARTDGQPIGWGTALVRELFGKLLLGFTVVWLIADALVTLADDRRQSLHDRLASTVVVPAQASDSARADSTGAATSAGR